MGTGAGRRLRAAFPAGVWAADVDARYPSSSRARTVADGARREFERDGVPERELQLCEPEGPEGTRLDGCLKLYLPLGPSDPRERPFGMVFIDVGRTEPALVLLAYGVRHQPRGAHADTVYRRAHQRLHPTRR
jgi:hypothetical protein